MANPLPDYETAMEWERKGIVPPGTNAHLPATSPSFKDVDADLPTNGKRSRIPKKIKRDFVKASFDIVSMTWMVPVNLFAIGNARDTRKLIGSKGKQKEAVFLVMGRCHQALSLFADDGIHRSEAFGGPRTIKAILTRLSPREMDDDNSDYSMKYVRDAVADMLGTKDNNKMLKWEYGQEKHPLYGVKIQLRLLPDQADPGR